MIQVTVEIPKETWNGHQTTVGELIGIATFLDANIEIQEID